MNFAINDQFDHQTKTQDQDSRKIIPEWIIWTQCICFAILYAIWNYPLTNFLSDVCMIVGALLSIYILYCNQSFFKTKQAIPFWLLLVLLLWIVFHLLFLSNNFPLQFRELTTIWKRVVIAIIFALGFGMALASAPPKKGYWVIFYVGMMMPALIFLGKYFLNANAPIWGLAVPDYLKLYNNREESLFYMYKTDYVSFCLPALGISLAQLRRNVQDGYINLISNFIYLTGIMAVVGVFYLNNIKNGIAYATILILCFLLLTLKTEFNKLKGISVRGQLIKRWALRLSFPIILGLLAYHLVNKHINQNPAWKSLLADSKVAIQVDQMDYWKYWGAKGYPLNEHGVTVSPTNYERLAWGIVGLRLLQQNPLGYGLSQNSFGYLTKRNWPDSRLTQSHSGWLDLALGIGIPGIGLILASMLMVLRSAVKNAGKKTVEKAAEAQGLWSSRFVWVLWTLLLLWCTTEISLKIPIISLMFWVSFGAGLSTLASSASLNVNKT